MPGENDPLNPDGNQEVGMQAGQEGGQAAGTDASASSEQASGKVSSQEAAPEPAPASDAGGTASEQPATQAGDDGGATAHPKLREPFPFRRLGLSLVYLVIAYIGFGLAVLLAFVQFVTIMLAGEKNDELQEFSRRVATCMKQIFDFMTLASDERPFPLGPFPKE